MNQPSEPQPRQRRYSVQHQAKLGASTLVKLEVLIATCHRKCIAIIHFIMQLGLNHPEGWTIDRCPVVAVPPVPVLLDPELLQQAQDAAAAYGAMLLYRLSHQYPDRARPYLERMRTEAVTRAAEATGR